MMSTLRDTMQTFKSTVRLTVSRGYCYVIRHTTEAAKMLSKRCRKLRKRVFKVIKRLIKWLGDNPEAVKGLIEITLVCLSIYKGAKEPENALNLLEILKTL